MPSITIRRDPFRPQLAQQIVSARAGTRLDTVLRREQFVVGRGKSLSRPVPFVVQVNGRWLVQSAWSVRLKDADVVTVVVLPAGGGGSNPLQMVAMVALAAVTAGVGAWAAGAYAGAAGVATTSGAALAVGASAAAAVAVVGGMAINSIFPPARVPTTMAREGASPTYTISAQGNMARPFESIPVRYGRYRSYLDFGSQPYTELDGNETYLYQLFVVGQGEFDIEKIQIEDTDIGNFEEVTYEVVRPGQRVTLFPDNVVTSNAVQGLELPAAGAAGAGAVGPFVANPSGTRTTQIAVDIALPRGLFYVNYKGALEPLDTTFVVRARQINDIGQPIGGFVVLGSERLELATATPQYKTYRYTVAEGRWEVSVERTSNEIPDRENRSARAITWLGLRAYLPSQQDYGNLTLLATRIRATNNLNQATARRVNVIATRKLRTWDPVNGWSAGVVATRNPAWAIADACTNPEYGKGLATSRLSIHALYRLAQIWDARGDRFDGVFDTTTTFWEAITQIARAGRAMPIYYAGVIDIIRDEPKTVRTQMYTPANIVARSMSIDYAFPDFTAPDHIIVEFVNEETWQDDEIVCALPGSPMARPYRLKLPGVTNRDQAWREGITLVVRNRDQRRFISLQTTFEGAIPAYADLVEVSHDIPKWGLTGWVEEFDPATMVLTMSEPLEWYEGQTHYLSLRKLDGSPDGPYRVVPAGPITPPAGLTAAELASLMSRRLRVIDADAGDIYVSDGSDDIFTHYSFGPGERRALLAQVMSATPDESGKWSLDLVNYSASVHAAELGGDVPVPEPVSLLPLFPNAPIVNEVTVYAAPEPGVQIASATPARGARSYEFEASSDSGASWSALGTSAKPDIRIELSEGMWRVRARGIGAMPGPWAVWVGQIAASMAPPPSLASLTATSLLFGIRLDWVEPDAPWIASTEFMYSQVNDLAQAIPMGAFATPARTYTMMGLRAGQRLYFWARLRDTGGNPGPWFPAGSGVEGQASNDVSLILEMIEGQIEESQLGAAFRNRIGKIEIDYASMLAEVGNNDAAIVDLINADKGIIDTVGREARERVAQYQGVVAELNKLIADVAAANTAIQAEATARIAAVKAVADGLAAEVATRAAALQGVVNTANGQAVQIAAVAASVAAEVDARKNAVSGLANSIDAQLGALQNDVAGLLGTEEFDVEKPYAANALTTYEGKLYRAIQPTTGNLPTNLTYWDELGDFSSLSDLVSNLASRMVSMEDLTAAQASLLTALQTLSGNTAASVSQLQQTSAAQALVLTALQTLAQDQGASLSTLQQTSLEQASLLVTLRADLNGQGASITGLQVTTATLATRTTTLEASTAQNGQAIEQANAQMTTLQEVSAQFALQLQQITAEMGNADAELVRIDEVQAGQIIALQRLRVTDGLLTSQIESVQSVAAEQASLLTTVRTQQGTQGAAITGLQQTTLTQAQALTSLTGRLGDAESSVATLSQASANQASLIATLRTDVNGHTGAISTLQQTSQGYAQRLTQLEASGGEGSAAIQQLQQVQGNHAQQLETLTATTSTHTSSLQTLAQASADQASLYTQLKSTVDGQGSTINQLSGTTATQAQQITALGTRAGAIEAAVSAVTQTAAGLASRLGTLEVKADGTATKVESLEQADTHKAMRLQQLEAELGNYDASLSDLYVVSENQARSLLSLAVKGEGYQSSIVELRDVSAQHAGRLTTVETTTTELVTGLASANLSLVAITNRTTSLETTSAAYALRFASVETLAGDNKAAVSTLQQTTAGMALQIGALQVTDGSQAASINLLQQVEAQVALMLQQIQAEMGNADASFTELFEVSAGVVRQQSLLQAGNDLNAASVRSLAEAVATGDAANATLITNLTARVGAVEGVSTANTAAITSEQAARANADTALTHRVDTAFANIGTANAAITSEAGTRATEDAALSGRIEIVSASAQSAQTAADQAKASAVTLAGLIQAEQNARATADEAFAQLVSTVQASVGDNRISIQDVSIAQANLNGQLAAQRMIRMEALQDGRLVFTGIGMGLESVGGILQSQMLFEADRFAFINRSNGSTVLPLVIENSQTIINDALIARLDAAKISFGQMHGDRIQVNSLWADRIHMDSLIGRILEVTNAFIKTAHIEYAAVNSLKIAGQSATVGSVFSHSGMYIDKSTRGGWQLFGFYSFSLPEGGDSLFVLNAWHDTNSSLTDEDATNWYEFKIKNEVTGEEFEGLPTATRVRMQGNVNSKRTSTLISSGNPPGIVTFTVFCRLKNPEETESMGAGSNTGYSTTARFKLFVLSRFR